MAVETQKEKEAHRLKTLAETKFNNSNLKSALKYAKRAHRLHPKLAGVAEMATAFSILRVASTSPDDWYKILQVEPFSHVNAIKKQYKKLALILHPDKNRCVGSEDAFKLVGEAFRFLSDKVRRKEYDMKLRIRIQDERIGESDVAAENETFWTSCSRCRLLHQFEKRYAGFNLVCPNCKRSFKAVEVEINDLETEKDDEVRDGSERLRNFVSVERLAEFKGKTSNREVSGEGSSGRLRSRKMSSVGEILERSKPKKIKIEEEMMTLAEIQAEAKRKAREEKLKGKTEEREEEEETEDKRKKKKKRGLEIEREETLRKRKRGFEIGNHGTSRKSVNSKMDTLVVEDSDFYDFDVDRVERSFKKGQVWAIYDDNDAMPRNYGMIDEVVSTNPFEVNISWLELDTQSNKNGGSMNLWEKNGFRLSCGRFKIGKKTSIGSLNIFSHIVDSERVAREIYWIYPKKGSVWALYNEAAAALDSGEDHTSYEIAVFLTTYSEMHGLSMGYLEKVDGFKTIFRRREIGCRAIRWFEKDDVRLFSHQIPARKLSDKEGFDLKDCWELDPASLPSNLLLTIRGGR